MKKRMIIAAVLFAGAATFSGVSSASANGNVAQAHPGGGAPVHVNPPPQHFNPPPQHFNPPPQHFNPPPQRFNPPPQRFNPPVVRPSPPVVRPSPPVVRPTPPVVRPTPPVVRPTPPVVHPTPPVVHPTPPVVRPTPPVVHPTPPVVHPTPPVVRPPVHPGHPGNTIPVQPGRPGKGSIKVHPGGPQTGINIGNRGPAFHRGGVPHSPFVHIVRRPLVISPVIVPYHGRWHPLPRYEYISSFYFGGSLYVGPDPFFWGYDDWGPTEWMYYADTGEWWQPGSGWSQGPGAGYSDVITVAVTEKVPLIDDQGDPVVDANGDQQYETMTVYYNAYWDPAYGAYGYMSKSGNYIWLRW